MGRATFLVRIVVSAFLLGSVAPLAGAQSVRVIAADASVYLNPDSTSQVLMVVKAGTLLETAGQKDGFYLVVLPPDTSGLRRVGYVAAMAVERTASTPVRPADRFFAPSPGSGVAPGQPWTAYGYELGGFIGSNRDLAGPNEAFAFGLWLGGLSDVRTENRLSSPWTTGLTFGAATGRYFVGFSEFSYTRAADAVFTGVVPSYYYYDDWYDVKVRMRAELYEVTFGGHVNVPLGRVVPYLGGGAGAMWMRARATDMSDDSAYSEQFDESATSEADWVAFVAVGARVFLTNRLGVRPEVRVVHVPDSHHYRLGVSVFGRF